MFYNNNQKINKNNNYLNSYFLRDKSTILKGENIIPINYTS